MTRTHKPLAISEEMVRNFLRAKSYIPSRLRLKPEIHGSRGYVVFTLNDDTLAVRYENGPASWTNDAREMMTERMAAVLDLNGLVCEIVDVDGDPQIHVKRFEVQPGGQKVQ